MSFVRYERYKRARTVQEYRDLGGTADDLRWDRRRGFVVADGDPFPEAEAALGEEDFEVPELKEARQRYAEQAEAFHAERERSGVAPPEDTAYSVRMLPFWEAAHVEEPSLDSAIEKIHKLAQIAACWTEHGAESHAGELERLRGQAETLYRDATVNFEAGVSELLKHKRAVDVPTPRTYNEAMRGIFAEAWKEAIESERQNLKSHGVYEWVPHPGEGVKVLDSNWAWKVKPAADGSVAKLKARVVGRGFREIYGIHFYQTFAPVGKLTTFRVLIAEGARRGMRITFGDGAIWGH